MMPLHLLSHSLLGTPPTPQNRQLLQTHLRTRSSGGPQSSLAPTNDRALAASSSDSNPSFGFSFAGKVVAVAVVRVLAGSSRQTSGQLFECAQLPHTQ